MKELKVGEYFNYCGKNTLLLKMPQEIVGIVRLGVPVDGVLMVR